MCILEPPHEKTSQFKVLPTIYLSHFVFKNVFIPQVSTYDSLCYTFCGTSSFLLNDGDHKCNKHVSPKNKIGEIGRGSFQSWWVFLVTFGNVVEIVDTNLYVEDMISFCPYMVMHMFIGYAMFLSHFSFRIV